MSKRARIVEFDNEYVYAMLLDTVENQNLGATLKIKKDRLGPKDWIQKGEVIWYVEHGYWNFERMFDSK